MTPEAYRHLAAQIVKSGIDAYRNPATEAADVFNVRQMPAETRRLLIMKIRADAWEFLTSEWCETLCDYVGVNPEIMIAKLRKEPRQ